MRIGQFTSLGILNRMGQTQKVMARALERISTGRRVNSPRDDVAAYFTAQRLETDSRGLSVVNRGLSMTRGLLETASAGLSAQTELLQRMRELSVQAASGTLTAEQRTSLQSELLSLRDEFDRITSSTEFGGRNLLDGSFSNFDILTDARGSSLSLELPDTSLSTAFTRTAGSGNFQAPSSFSAGGKPSETLVADLNGDGLLDLVTANETSLDLHIRLGRGDGTFEAANVISLGTVSGAASGVEVADFNGDNVLDLAVSISDTDSIGILLGNGDGTFGSLQTSSFGSLPGQIVAGDFNGDGKMDLAGVSTGDPSFVIRLGNGDGTFQAQSSFSNGIGPSSLSSGDVNGDGYLDLVVNDAAAGDAYLHLGNGDGTFTLLRTMNLEGSPYDSELVDLNGDGNLDLISANGAAGSISVLLGNGDGSFQSQVTYGAGGDPRRLQVGDLNGDGNLDLVAGDLDAASSFRILWGDGSGSFTSQTNITSVSLVATVALGDFDRDGALDIVAHAFSDFEAYVHLGVPKRYSVVSDLSLLSAEQAQTTLSIIDNALENILSAQSRLGASLNRLDFTQSANENRLQVLEEARSQLLEADLALETSELVRAQILQQAQVAALTQANTQMQMVLELLRPLGRGR